MELGFDARIQGTEIHCDIVSDRALSGAVFCCSIFTPGKVVSGGTLVRQVAGYLEVALPDLVAGVPHRVVLAHQEASFTPKNRAWLPLGPYLRTKNGPLPLPATELGVRFDTEPPRVVPEFAGLKLVPQPTRWRAAGGTVSVVGFACDDAQFQAVDALALRRGLGAFLVPGGLWVTIVRDEGLGADHVIEISAKGVVLRAGGDLGLFSAAITLLTLRETYDGQLPLGGIEDGPRFGYRGQMLDCARHFFEVETILKLLDLVALLKLNRFHWHLADDEAFRLQVDCAPDIWQKTQFRGEGEVVHGVFGGGIRSGGSYSKADVKRVLAHASALQIEVLPEIEVPAHGFALNMARSGMRDRGDNGAEISIQGYPVNILNPALDATWALLEPLCMEVAKMFRMGMLHLGCDELPPDAWGGSAAVAKLKVEHGLNNRDDVQGWAMAKLAGYLADRGIRTAAWEEAAKGANGGIGHDSLLFSWTGQGPGVEAARAGHQVVMCPAQHVYFDMAHTRDWGDWGASWAAYVALEDVVNWKPIPVGAEDIADKVVGVEGTFWGEFTTHDAEMEPMLAPRILGMANKAWDRTDRVDGTALRALAQAYGPLFDRIGWQRHKGA